MTRHFSSAKIRLCCFRMLNYVLTTLTSHRITDKQAYSAIGLSQRAFTSFKSLTLEDVTSKRGINATSLPRRTYISRVAIMLTTARSRDLFILNKGRPKTGFANMKGFA